MPLQNNNAKLPPYHMNKKICCVFNYAPHYRYPIYQLMDKELLCDFYFGDVVGSKIKKLDYQKLNGFKKELKNTSVLNTSFTWQWRAWQLVFKKYKYFIITGDPYYLSNWAILILGRILGKQIIPWSHGMKGNTRKRMFWFEYLFFKLSSKILLYGNHSRKHMLKLGFDEKKLVCIYNSLDHTKQIQLRKTTSWTGVYRDFFGNNFPVLLYIGRIQQNKKLEVLVNSLNELNKMGQPCNLIFIGEDLGDNNVKAQANSSKYKNQIWFYGACYNEKVISELLYNANICVSPGPVGLTALHALTFGTPVLTNNMFDEQAPEYEVIKENITGDFFNLKDSQDIRDKIKKWIKLTEANRPFIRENCYKIIDQHWNPDNQIKILKKLLNYG